MLFLSLVAIDIGVAMGPAFICGGGGKPVKIDALPYGEGSKAVAI